MSADVTIRWLAFHEHQDELLEVLQRVYVEEQGFGQDVVSTPYDDTGLHLGAFVDSKLVSTVSTFIFEGDSPDLVDYRLPKSHGRIVRFGKRASLKEFRSRQANLIVTAIMIRAIYETLMPDCVFSILRGVHQGLASYYISKLGYQYHLTLESDIGSQQVLTIPDAERIRASYLKVRNIVESAIEESQIEVPSLVRFLEEEGRTDLIATDRLLQENLYQAPLALKDEFPRLSAQTRVLYREQKPRLSATAFPEPPARLLDLGAGPGVYLAMLSRMGEFRGYELVGLDPMPEMVTYARINRPDLRWIEANAYETREPDESYDVIHVNFVFIHFFNPAVALREICRILKPGGLLYLVETNDSTFEGPPTIAELIRSHCELHLGNRRLLNSLPGLARQHGLALVKKFSTRVRNTGVERTPHVFGDELLLDRITMWSLYSFLGQRRELATQLRVAQAAYFSGNCEISVCLQTQVYRKLVSASDSNSSWPRVLDGENAVL